MDGVVAILVLFFAIVTGAAAALSFEQQKYASFFLWTGICLFNLATYAFRIQS